MKDWESELMGRVASDKGWSLVEAFSRQMRCLPEEVRKGADVIVNALRDCGIEPVVHTPEIYLGIPISASVVSGAIQIKAKASALSPSVENLTAPLVHLMAKPSQQGVHPGDAASLFEVQFATDDDARAAVDGRIVLTEGLSNPARTQLLQSWGAAAVIVINPGDRSHWGTNSTIWGSPVRDEINLLPKIASVAVSRAEGDELLALVGTETQITLNVDALHGWFEQPVVTAEIPGEGPEADDFVLLHSHYDSWEYGVGDNATGNAVLLEVARLFTQNPKPFRRSVRFAWWPGHSAGRYAGSAWYAEAFDNDLNQNCIAHVNCDSPGCKDATSYASIRSMTEAGPLVAQSVKDLFDQTCSIVRPGRAGDYSFNNLGISGAMLTSSMVPKDARDRRGWYAVGGCGGSPAWHSEFDTLEVADRGVLENDTKLYALITARLANESRVPLDYAATLRDVLRFVLELPDTQAHAAKSIHTFDQLSTLLKRLKSVQSEDPATNRALKRMSRAIVRLNYTIGAPDVQDAARTFPPVPLLSEVTTLEVQESSKAGTQAQEHLQSVQTLIDEMKDALATIDTEA